MMARQREMMFKQQALSPPHTSPLSLTPSFNVSSDEEPRDCVVTAWSPWSVSCSASCGQGHRNRFRSVSQEARGGGKRCPDKLERFKRCRLPSCPLDECDSASWAPCAPAQPPAAPRAFRRG